MTSALHVIDDSARWEHRIGISQLLAARDDGPSGVVALSAGARAALATLDLPVALCARGIGRRGAGSGFGAWLAHAAAAVGLRRFVGAKAFDVIHAWGVSAAHAAAAATARETPVVVTLFDPDLSERQIKLLRGLGQSSRFAAACTSAHIRRRLIEGGVAPKRCVVIRPGVDFSVINAAKRGNLRRRLGLTGAQRAVILPDPVTRAGHHITGFLAGALHCLVSGDCRVLVPSGSRESRRVVRFAATIPVDNVVLCVDETIPFEQLVAIADVLVVPTARDYPTTSIAWAMAAGTAVIAAASPATTELIADKTTGLLYKLDEPAANATSIARLLADRVGLDKAAETARGQAYEVFGVRRYVDQTGQLYRNLMSDVEPGSDITDSARCE